MAITKWDPLREIERFFEDSTPRMPFSQIGWDLAVDVYEKDNNIIAKMNLPGINPDTIDVEVKNDVLHIKGSREDEKEVQEKDYYSKEIRRGSFERKIRLPSEVHSEKADAEFKEGVLKVILPKKENGQNRNKIAIRK